MKNGDWTIAMAIVLAFMMGAGATTLYFQDKIIASAKQSGKAIGQASAYASIALKLIDAQMGSIKAQKGNRPPINEGIIANIPMDEHGIHNFEPGG